MASRSDEDYTCSICHDIYNDPVVLSCSHSFCKACLQGWWRRKQVLVCPYCKRISSSRDPPCNLALKNLCEAFSKEKDRGSSMESEGLCSLHAKKLRLFCLDHEEVVCLICRDSKKHTDHTFRPIDEAAQDQRVELQKHLKPLQQKLKQLQQVKGNWDQTAKHIQVQTRHTETQIKEQFEKLHQFLKEEEQARITALREEEEQKSKVMKEQTEALSRDIAALSHTVRVSEEELRAEDTSFLLNYKAAVERVQQHPLQEDPQLLSGALIDVAKHLGNLSFNIWNKMKELVSYTPVILDPNTADPELVVSEDLTSVKSGEHQQLPKTQERSKFSCSVLTRQGFNSGAHSWAIDVGENKDWELGVLGEHIKANEQQQAKLWRIMFFNGKLTAFSTLGSEQVLSLKKDLKKIRVNLDFNKKTLSFYDLDSNTQIHTFKHTFTDTLFPYVYTESLLSLKILPVKVCVTVGQHS